MQTELEVDRRTPFLFRYAEPRIDCTDIPGAYDAEQQVWCVRTADGLVPLVRDGSEALEIQTKTRVRQEADDSVISLVQLRTKTFVTEEVDDDQHVRAALPEIGTKTMAQIEGDDQVPTLRQ